MSSGGVGPSVPEGRVLSTDGEVDETKLKRSSVEELVDATARGILSDTDNINHTPTLEPTPTYKPIEQSPIFSRSLVGVFNKAQENKSGGTPGSYTELAEITPESDMKEAKSITIKCDDGGVLEGMWDDGKQIDEQGNTTYIYGEGNKCFVGVKKYSDGSQEEGIFDSESFALLNGIQTDSKGTYLVKDRVTVESTRITQTGVSEIGKFENNYITEGTRVYPDGIEETGQFKVKEGLVFLSKGIQKLKDGRQFIGIFENGKLVQGTKYSPEKKLLEQGTFDESGELMKGEVLNGDDTYLKIDNVVRQDANTSTFTGMRIIFSSRDTKEMQKQKIEEEKKRLKDESPQKYVDLEKLRETYLFEETGSFVNSNGRISLTQGKQRQLNLLYGEITNIGTFEPRNHILKEGIRSDKYGVGFVHNSKYLCDTSNRLQLDISDCDADEILKVAEGIEKEEDIWNAVQNEIVRQKFALQRSDPKKYLVFLEWFIKESKTTEDQLKIFAKHFNDNFDKVPEDYQLDIKSIFYQSRFDVKSYPNLVLNEEELKDLNIELNNQLRALEKEETSILQDILKCYNAHPNDPDVFSESDWKILSALILDKNKHLENKNDLAIQEIMKKKFGLSEFNKDTFNLERSFVASKTPRPIGNGKSAGAVKNLNALVAKKERLLSHISFINSPV